MSGAVRRGEGGGRAAAPADPSPARRGAPRVSVAESPRPAARNVVLEIAARRREDVRRALDELGRDGLARARRGPDPAHRRGARRSRPPPHRRGQAPLAVGRRRSPRPTTSIARARAYAAGGASAISVLCEPHWFGGSVDDLRAVRSAVAVPVLAKEFVVDPGSSTSCGLPGPTSCCCWRSCTRRRGSPSSPRQARDLGLEPLIEAHDAGEIERALAAGARLIGVNNRDLRTLDVDPERAVAAARADPGRPARRSPSPGVRDAGDHRPLARPGFDAALVGESLMRAPDPGRGARFVAAGRDAGDLAADARAPFVKICGVTDAAGCSPPSAAGADAVGLNFVPGTPRALSIEEGAELARLARAGAARGPRRRSCRHGGSAAPRRCAGSWTPWTRTRSS